MAEAGGQVVELAEAPTLKPGERPPGTDAAPFIARVQHLMTRVRNARLRNDQQKLQELQEWIDTARKGEIDFDSVGVLELVATIEADVDELVHSRTQVRRITAPMVGLGILAAVMTGVAAWAVAANVIVSGTALSVPVLAVAFGMAGSSFRVLLRALAFQYELTDRRALFMLGLARPVVGGVLGLAVFAAFGSGWISLPLVSQETDTTTVAFLGFPEGGGGIVAGQLAVFALAFVAGLLEGIFIPAAGRGVARVANVVSRVTSN